MSATTTPHAVDPPRSRVALRRVAIVIWGDDGPEPVDERDLRNGAADEATRTGRPIWLQLALPRLTPVEQKWFEGSVDPWDPTEAPELDLGQLDEVLELIGMGRSTLEHHERLLLDRLPQLYGRGVARVAREVWGRQACPPAQLRFFPTVAFRPVADSNPPSFWAVRMTVGVIRNVVVTVRLPDLRWKDATEAFEYRPRGPITIARRFFPVADDLTAEDVAEAIGLQQASTARAVSELVGEELRELERTRRENDGGADARKRDRRDAGRVAAMREHLHQLDRQLARLLRRFELDRSASSRGSIAGDIAVRYRFALDELRSLEANCQLTSQAIGQAITTGEQFDRERFHFVAAALASSILIPTLVASIYGANVALPARDSPQGFVALILFIAAFALFGLIAISKALPHESMPRMRWLGRLPMRIAASLVACAALIGGVVAAA